MQRPKTVRIPLTIVGIVSNVVAMVLVCVLLYSETQSNWPSIQQVAESIRVIAETRRVTVDSLVRLLGECSNQTSGHNNIAVGEWEVPMGNESRSYDLQYLVGVSSDVEKDRYIVLIVVKHTYRRGLKYLYENVVKAFKVGKLFPLEAISEFHFERLTLTNPK